MDIRVITLRYSDGAQGFPEEALLKAVSGREILEAREHFFVHGKAITGSVRTFVHRLLKTSSLHIFWRVAGSDLETRH